MDIIKAIKDAATKHLSAWMSWTILGALSVLSFWGIVGRATVVGDYIDAHRGVIFAVGVLCLVVSYNYEQSRVRREITSTRVAFAKLVENQKTLAQALSDQDTVRYIDAKMGELHGQKHELTKCWDLVIAKSRNLQDWEAQDGYGNFNFAMGAMINRIGETRRFVLETYGIDLSQYTDIPQVPPDCAGVPDALRSRFEAASCEYSIACYKHEAVVADLQARSRAAVERIQQRLARGAPWP